MAMISLPNPSRRIAARCPRCSGRLAFERDRHGAYLSCLVCGCVLEERTGAEAVDTDEDRAAWWRAQAS
jgi:hypothetical protein